MANIDIPYLKNDGVSCALFRSAHHEVCGTNPHQIRHSDVKWIGQFIVHGPSTKWGSWEQSGLVVFPMGVISVNRQTYLPNIESSNVWEPRLRYWTLTDLSARSESLGNGVFFWIGEEVRMWWLATWKDDGWRVTQMGKRLAFSRTMKEDLKRTNKIDSQPFFLSSILSCLKFVGVSFINDLNNLIIVLGKYTKRLGKQGVLGQRVRQSYRSIQPSNCTWPQESCSLVKQECGQIWKERLRRRSQRCRGGTTHPLFVYLTLGID